MSIPVLILTIVGALGECALGLFTITTLRFSMPMPVVLGCVFAEGMLISFLLILIIGAMGITSHAADFVKDSMGRFLLLALGSVVLLFGLGTGSEALYEHRSSSFAGFGKRGAPDVVFVLDHSASMSYNYTSTGESCMDALHMAFRDVVNSLEGSQRISVVRYSDTASILLNWTQLNDVNREGAIKVVENALPSGGTNYSNALVAADELVGRALDDRRNVVVVMLSDGEGDEVDIQRDTPIIGKNHIRIYTMGIGVGDFSSLEGISRQTEAEMIKSAADISSITTSFRQVIETAVSTASDLVLPDTLLSPDYQLNSESMLYMVIHIVLLLIISFVFRLIINICIGNNARSAVSHVLSALLVSAMATAAIVFLGRLNGLDRLKMAAAAQVAYWVLMMTQVVFSMR